jgi:RNA polymerase sigma-70 factor, ECF subfamily
MARENPRWGYLRIRGELLKLRVRVSATAIRSVLRRCGLGPAPRRSGPSWSEFLRTQAHGEAVCFEVEPCDLPCRKPNTSALAAAFEHSGVTARAVTAFDRLPHIGRKVSSVSGVHGVVKLREEAVSPPLSSAEGGFSAFFEREYERLCKATLLLTGDWVEAEDMTQEAMARAYERWDQIAAGPSPTGYVYRTVMNLNRNRLRRLARFTSAILRAAAEPVHDEIEDRSRRMLILETLQKLTSRQREAIVLLDWAGLDTQEAAAITGTRPGALRVRLHRARKAMAQLLQEEE